MIRNHLGETAAQTQQACSHEGGVSWPLWVVGAAAVTPCPQTCLKAITQASTCLAMDSFLKLKKGSPVKRTHTTVLASLTGFSHGLDQGGRSSTEPPGPPDRSSDPLKVPGGGGICSLGPPTPCLHSHLPLGHRNGPQPAELKKGLTTNPLAAETRENSEKPMIPDTLGPLS